MTQQRQLRPFAMMFEALPGMPASELVDVDQLRQAAGAGTPPDPVDHPFRRQVIGLLDEDFDYDGGHWEPV